MKAGTPESSAQPWYGKIQRQQDTSINCQYHAFIDYILARMAKSCSVQMQVALFLSELLIAEHQLFGYILATLRLSKLFVASIFKTSCSHRGRALRNTLQLGRTG